MWPTRALQRTAAPLLHSTRCGNSDVQRRLKELLDREARGQALTAARPGIVSPRGLRLA